MINSLPLGIEVRIHVGTIITKESVSSISRMVVLEKTDDQIVVVEITDDLLFNKGLSGKFIYTRTSNDWFLTTFLRKVSLDELLMVDTVRDKLIGLINPPVQQRALCDCEASWCGV